MSSDEQQQMKILKELGGPRMYNNYTYIPEDLSCFRRNEILSELIPYIEQLESIVDRSVTGRLNSSLIHKELKAMKAVRARLEDTSNTPSCSIMGGRRRKSRRRKSRRRKSRRSRR